MGKPELRVPAMKLQIHIPEQASSRRHQEPPSAEALGCSKGWELGVEPTRLGELLAFLLTKSCTNGASPGETTALDPPGGQC